eukprot:TRINITY_DN2017_c2_g1_i4.p2 TRINITY_DN2017_c2_g1~~TRINITY_DN2017_c2_g1_i4.p2  ORF type:complete len:359 (-),score=82.08 TRINITY_DN2017_c2_g1_i4:92-1168(-)
MNPTQGNFGKFDIRPDNANLTVVAGTPKGPCEERDLYDPFKGNNEEFEIEDIDEFHSKLVGKDIETLSMSKWVFQAVDFSHEPIDMFRRYNIKGAWFLGCLFPNGVSLQELRDRGARVMDNQFDEVPFNPFRAFLYDQRELSLHDAAIYDYYKNNSGLIPTMAMSLHDYSIQDALGDYLEGKTPIGFMGGHRLMRGSTEYRDLVYLARSLARNGFLIVTGGGPGAMEAANLGGYLANKTDQDVEEALKIISSGNEGYEGLEYTNIQSAQNVIDRFGVPDYMPSLGIPTYRYGHEPSNKFASYHAKFFQNSIREDGLLSICTGGIVYVRGGAGTRQELFQAACHNTYCKPQDTKPTVSE